MHTKHTNLLSTLIFFLLITSSISYTPNIPTHYDGLKQSISTNRIYWTCEYHPQQRFYSTRMPGIQGCSYSPDGRHVWTEHTE